MSERGNEINKLNISDIKKTILLGNLYEHFNESTKLFQKPKEKIIKKKRIPKTYDINLFLKGIRDEERI